MMRRKTYEYRDAKIELTPDAETNEVGDDHELTAKVYVNIVGQGWVLVPDATPVVFSITSGDAKFIANNGTTLTVNTGTASVGVAKATHRAATRFMPRRRLPTDPGV
jgi:hypothetical protein